MNVWENRDDPQLVENVYKAADDLVKAIEEAKSNGLTVYKPERWSSDKLADHIKEIGVKRDYDRALRDGDEEERR